MGFTSNFIQKYNYFLNNGNSMKGFMSYDLSGKNISDVITPLASLADSSRFPVWIETILINHDIFLYP